MPEDQAQVAEQQETTTTTTETNTSSPTVEDQEGSDKDFDSGWGEEEEPEEESKKTLGEKKDSGEQKEPEEKKDETDKTGQEEKETNVKEPAEGGEETDEDIVRGKALLDEEKARDEEERIRQGKAKADEDARKKDQRAEEQRNAGFGPLDQNTADILMDFAHPRLFDKPIKIGNNEYDLAEYVKMNPEVVAIAGTMMNNFIGRLMNMEIIPTMDAIKAKFGDELWEKGLPDRFSDSEDRAFRLEIMTRGIPEDPMVIIDTPEFKAWFPKQRDEIKALRLSGNPADHARLYRRFFRDSKAPAVAKKEEIETKQREIKDKKDKLFGSTVNSGKGKGAKGAGGKDKGASSDDFDAGWDEAGDDKK